MRSFVNRLCERPDVCWSTAVFLFALALRFAYLQQPQTPLASFSDANAYFQAGRSRATGSVTPGDWKIIASRGPVYPVFLAAIFKIAGAEPTIIRYLQALLGAATCLFLYDLGRRFASRTAAIVASAFTAVCPGLLLQTGHIHTETLATFLLWGGVWLLMIGVERAAWTMSGYAGAVISLACLARPTLLPAAPFLILSVWIVARNAARMRRVLLAAAFAAALLAPLGAWSLYASAKGGAPTAGAAGVKTMLSVAEYATHPTLRGWNPARFPDQSGPPGLGGAVRRVPAALSLVFMHGWFADNVWRQTFVFSPSGLDCLQRLLSLVGLAGVGIAWLRRWSIAPVLAILAGYVITAVKYIELRPMLPFLPALFLCGGLGVSTVFERLKTAGRTITLPAWILPVLALTFILLPLNPLTVMQAAPFLHPATAGWFCDCGIVLLAGLWGLVGVNLLRDTLAPVQARVAAFLPACVFAILFASYALVASVPRWRGFALDVSNSRVAITHEIHLPAPLLPEQIESANVLVDLRSSLDLPQLEISVNGGPPSKSLAPIALTPPVLDLIYGELAAFSGLRITQCPRWWSLPVDSSSLAGGDVVSITLTPRAGGNGQLLLGCNIPGRCAGAVFQGPSPNPGLTSPYRWEVLDDWRLWDATPLASAYTRTRVSVNGNELPGRQRRFVELLNTHRAEANIRLVVRLKDGRQLIY